MAFPFFMDFKTFSSSSIVQSSVTLVLDSSILMSNSMLFISKRSSRSSLIGFGVSLSIYVFRYSFSRSFLSVTFSSRFAAGGSIEILGASFFFKAQVLIGLYPSNASLFFPRYLSTGSLFILFYTIGLSVNSFSFEGGGVSEKA